jgi:hypothetical protein
MLPAISDFCCAVVGGEACVMGALVRRAHAIPPWDRRLPGWLIRQLLACLMLSEVYYASEPLIRLCCHGVYYFFYQIFWNRVEAKTLERATRGLDDGSIGMLSSRMNREVVPMAARCNREGNDSPQRRLHGGARRVGRSVGEGSEEWLRLELELSVSSMGTRQSSWYGRLGRGMTGGAGLTVRCSHGGGGRCRLCFGEFLWGRLGGRQLDATALLGEVRPEPRGGCSGGGRGGPRHGVRAAAERRREAEEQSGMGAGSEW